MKLTTNIVSHFTGGAEASSEKYTQGKIVSIQNATALCTWLFISASSFPVTRILAVTKLDICLAAATLTIRHSRRSYMHNPQLYRLDLQSLVCFSVR